MCYALKSAASEHAIISTMWPDQVIGLLIAIQYKRTLNQHESFIHWTNHSFTDRLPALPPSVGYTSGNYIAMVIRCMYVYCSSFAGKFELSPPFCAWLIKSLLCGSF